MTQTREAVYKELKEGEQVGPDHHKFQLRGSAVDCPLGQLWQADDVSTTTPVDVSLIMLDPIFLQNKPFLANFKKQIVRSKGISHPHVADIYGYFIHKGGLLFFAFEAVEGLNLDQLITSSSKNRINIKQIQGLLTQLSAAIISCSKHWHLPLGGIDNQFVFVNKKGGVKFLPISMREFFHEAEDVPGNVYSYKSSCSPQALDKASIDASSDSYAIAYSAYRLLGGDTFPSTDTQEQRDEVKLNRPSEISDQQWDHLQQALSGDSKKRFANAADFVKKFFASEKKDQPEDSDPPAEITLDSTASSATGGTQISFNLGKKAINFRLPFFVIPLLLLLLGLGTGFILGVFSSAGKIDSANANADKWKAQAIEQEQQIAINQQQLSKAQAKATNLEIKSRSLEQQIGTELDAGATPLSVFRDPLSEGQYGPDMVVLAPGSFQMGDIGQVGNDNEKPVHPVTLTRKFAIARYEITFAQYDFFALQTDRKLPDDEGWGRELQPVINVTWREARAYTRWLAKETGLDYRLPTEAEWEYAARAGTTTNYWWGDENLAGYSHCSDCGDPLGGKQPLSVGSMKANPWGLHDLNGNVDEWVMDCFSENYTNASTTGEPRPTPGCSNRAMRGGSWFDITRETRSASRYRHPPDTKRNSWGFRVALAVD